MPDTAVNINDSFFKGIYKEAWRQLIPPGLSEAEAEFISETCALQENSCVLDLMSGYGRHALPLGRKGIKVTAVDNSPEYIDEINRVANTEAIPVTGVCTGALGFTGTLASFDAAICMGNSLNFFTRPDCQAILNNVSDCLKPGGWFVLNSWMIAEIAYKYFKEREWYHAGTYKCLLDYRLKLDPARIESEQTILSPTGEVESIEGIDYLYTLDELEAMFANAGIQTIGRFSTPGKRPFEFGSTRIYIVAQKINPAS